MPAGTITIDSLLEIVEVLAGGGRPRVRGLESPLGRKAPSGP